MTEALRLARNRELLRQCHPAFKAQLAKVILALQANGWRPRLQCTWRHADDEDMAFNSGHSEVRWGYHNATAADGTPEALAGDLLDDNAPLHPHRDYLLALARAARPQGLRTGILWGLPANMRRVVDGAIRSGTEWTGPIGWDPCHVETTAVTLAEAKAGRRPALRA